MRMDVASTYRRERATVFDPSVIAYLTGLASLFFYPLRRIDRKEEKKYENHEVLRQTSHAPSV